MTICSNTVMEAIVSWAWADTWASDTPEEAYENASDRLSPALESYEALDELVLDLCDRHSGTFDWDERDVVRAYARELFKGPNLSSQLERALRTLAQQEQAQ